MKNPMDPMKLEPGISLGHENYSYTIPNNKSLDFSNLTALADGKTNDAEMMFYLSDRVENIVGKGENAGYQHFLLFSHFFSKPRLC